MGVNRFSFLILLLHFAAIVNADVVDSLKQKISIAKNDTNKTKLLNELGWEYIYAGEFDSATATASRSLELANNLKFKKGIAAAYNCLGVVKDYQGQYKEALDFHFKSLQIKKQLGNKYGMSASLANISNIFVAQGNYPKALKFQFESLKIKQDLNDAKGISNSFNTIGTIYFYTKEYPKALDYFKKAYSLAVENELLNGVPNTLNNIGAALMELNDFDGAMNNFQKSIDICLQLNDQLNLANTYGNIGQVYTKKKNYDDAIRYNFKSLEVCSKIDQKLGIAQSMNNLGFLYKEKGQHGKALKYLLQAYELGISLNYLEIIRESALNLKDVYRRQNDLKSSLKFYDIYINAKDSINNEEKTRSQVQAEMNFEFEKKEAIAKAEQVKQKQLHRVELANQRLQRNGFIAGFVLMLSLAGVSYRSYRNKKKSNTIIIKQKEEVEIQKHIVEEKQKEILDSITYAKRIQNAILPPSKMVKEFLPDSFVLYKPKDIVAGDFYWMLPTEQGVLFAAADSTGHGVPGALVSVVCNNALNRSVREYQLTDPGQILNSTRKIVIAEFQKSEEEVKDGMDISLCYLTGRTLTWAGANNPLWLLKAKTKELLEFKPDKQPIGKYADEKPFKTHYIELEEGDVIYIFTDGYADQFGGEKGKKFKYSQLKELLVSISGEPMERQKSLLNEAFESWKGNLEQIDDVSLIGVRV